MRPVLGLVFLGALAAPLAAQLPVSLRGEIGSSGELYRMNGTDPRRPGATGEMYIRGSLDWFGRVKTEVDILVSSEDGTGLSGTPGIARQRLNRFGISPGWSWGRLHLGSFTDQYSEYTLNGIRLTGAGVSLNPGLLRVGTLYGQVAQPIVGGATDGSYRRRMVGGRLGVGRLGQGSVPRSFFDVMLFRVWDDVGSLSGTSQVIDTAAGVPVNTLSVTPEENVVAAATGKLNLLQGRLVLNGEASGAIHSRDRRATELEDSEVHSYPGVLRGLLTPRVSTHADYAWRMEAQYQIAQLPGGTPRSPRTMALAADYSYIGPGYVSLGVASLPADQRAVGLRSQVRFPRWNASIMGRFQQDNLLGQKLATTDRMQLGGNVTLRVSRKWTTMIRGYLLTMENGVTDSLRQIAYRNRSLGFGNTVSLGRSTMVRSVSLNYGYQASGDDNPLRAESELASHDVDVRVNLAPSPTLNIAPSIGMVRARTGTAEWNTRESYALSVTSRMLDGRLTTTFAAATSRAQPNRSTRASISSRFQLSELQEVSLRMSLNRLRGPLEDGDFEEYLVRFEITRRLP
jgi:hypothetical protein